MVMLALVLQLAISKIEMVAVIGVDAAEPIEFAAQELSRYLEKASGLPVRVKREARLTGRNVLALVVPGSRLEQSVPMPDSADEEAYRRVSVAGGGRTFTGRSPRAALYAVYDFLEEEAVFHKGDVRGLRHLGHRGGARQLGHAPARSP